MNNKDTSRALRKEGLDGVALARLDKLLGHLRQLLPDPAQAAAFRRASLTPPPAGLRLNPLIPQSATLRPILQERGRQVPWCREAFVLPEPEQRIGRTLEHAVGALYIQAKAPTLAVEILDPQPDERILDLAAAPGGKATQIGARMRNTGLLLANEPRNKRVPALVGNLERCGLSNAVLSQAPGNMLARYFHNYFDRILLDAPCSGDGILCKDKKMLRYWTVADAQRQAQQQKGLLRAAFHMLRPGGFLVYSTCSLSLEENEEVIQGLVDKYPGQVEILPSEIIDPVPLPAAVAERYPADFAHIVRIWPHLHDTEGACVARMRKEGTTTWPAREADAATWTTATASEAGACEARERLQEQWGFAMPCPSGQTLELVRRHLYSRPREAAAFQQHFPFYIRAGMRIARRHKDHYYLTQQAITMWGMSMRTPRLELSWPQVQSLFQGLSIPLEDPTALKGEIVCSFGPWALCRALVRESGHLIQSMLPRELLCTDVGKLG